MTTDSKAFSAVQDKSGCPVLSVSSTVLPAYWLPTDTIMAPCVEAEPKFWAI